MNHRYRLRAALVLVTCVHGSGVVQAQSDPFSAGLRWIHQAPAAQPYVPENVAFAGYENFVWASASGAASRLMLLDAQGQSPHAPRFEDNSVAVSVSSVIAAAGRRPDAVFAAVQYPQPDIFHRRTVVSRHDPLQAAQGQSFTPVWEHEVGRITNGPAMLVADETGSLAVAAVWDSVQLEVQIDWLDGGSGALLATVTVPAVALNAVQIADNGSRVALACGLDLFIFNRAGRELYHEVLPSATQALAVSGDGRSVVYGGFSRWNLVQPLQGSWQRVQTISVPGTWIASRAALSFDGAVLAIAWWDYVSGNNVRFELWDTATLQALQSFVPAGNQGSFQSLPVATCISRDGSRAAFGSWGSGGSDPEVLLVESASATPVLAIDLPGSVRDLDLDESGTRVVVSYKDTHANQFSSTGGIRTFDSGERDLQVVAATESGGELFAVARATPNSAVFFLVGQRAANPILIPGVAGSLLLDRSTLAVYPRATAADGRADLHLPVTSDPALIGTHWSLQSAQRISGSTVLGSALVDSFVLND